MLLPLGIALAVLLLTTLAETLHARRVRVVGRLAFGPAGGPREWARLAGPVRVVCLTAFAWGLATLIMLKGSSGAKTDAGAHAGTHVLLVTDLSPSMLLRDAGLKGEQTRRERMRDVVDSLLVRIGGDVRYTIAAFYTQMLPVALEVRDHEIVRNVYDGLPLSYAMPPGKTDLSGGVNAALQLARDNPIGSTHVFVLSDGDTGAENPYDPLPASVASVTVLGFGNADRGIFIDGHNSRQEAESLRRLAASLRGTYFDANVQDVPTPALGNLVVRTGLDADRFDLLAWAIIAMTAGASIYALLPVALEYFGSDWRAEPLVS